jgi:hypothetical protein
MKEISESSLKIYNGNLNSISKAINVVRDDKEKWLETNSKRIIDYIKTKPSNHTQKNLYSAVIAIGKRKKISETVLKPFEDEMYGAAVEVEQQYETNQMSDKQKDNWITSEQLDKRIMELRSDLPSVIDTYSKYKKLMIYLVVLIHSKIPLRNDLVDAKIYHDKDLPKELSKEANYVIIGSKPRIILNVYKTAKDYGEKVIPLDKTINDELLKYYDEMTAFSGNHWFLVQKERDENLGRTQFINWFQSAFPGKKVGTTMLRTMAVSEMYEVKPEQYKKEQALAEVMGHSMSLARLKYAKVLPAQK